MTNKELCKVVTDYLTGLGDTADEIAASLQAAGIKGHVCEQDLCPLAVGLLPLLPVRPFVGRSRVQGVGGMDCPMPEAAISFVKHFDAGHYPYLEER